MEALFKTLVNSLLLPPGINIILCLLGILIWQRFHIAGTALLAISIISLYGLCTPIVASRLINSLQQIRPLELTTLNTTDLPQAIMVLTGGDQYAPEYQRHLPSYSSMMRELYAAKLYQATQLPIMITGKGHREEAVEARAMQQHLAEQFNIPTTWLEPNSHNTWENACFVKKLLRQHDITSFYLVTSAWHMKRALTIFAQMGYQPTPAPTDFLLINGHMISLFNWRPSARMLLISKLALHEYLSLIWYHLFDNNKAELC